MNINQSIEKPIKRGWLRKKIGREYFIFKRFLDWKIEKKDWAQTSKIVNLKLYNLLIRKL